MKIMEFDLKWVHMARYELKLRQDGALWLRIIFKPLLTQQRVIKSQNGPTRCGGRAKRGPELLVFVYQFSRFRGIVSQNLKQYQFEMLKHPMSKS